MKPREQSTFENRGHGKKLKDRRSFVHLILVPILHLSTLKVHEYANLLWWEVHIYVCGAEGVLVPEEC